MGAAVMAPPGGASAVLAQVSSVLPGASASESQKAQWQAEADARGVSLSALVRERMQTTGASGALTAPPTNPLTAAEYRDMLAEIDARRPLDVSVPELAELRDTLDLRDVDGEHSPLLADWRAYAVLHDMSFGELLEAVVLEANAELVA